MNVHMNTVLHLLLLTTLNMVSFPVVACHMGETLVYYLSLTEVKWSLCDVFVLLICLQHKGMKIIQFLMQFSSVECHHYRYMLCGSSYLATMIPGRFDSQGSMLCMERPSNSPFQCLIKSQGCCILSALMGHNS